MPTVIFSFDPACLWTWRTSRWLVAVAPQRDLDIDWRSFSLFLVNDGDLDDEHRGPVRASARAQRLIEALRVDGRFDDVPRFYAEMGARSHEKARPLDLDGVRAAADAAGVADRLDALDDERFDALIRRSHDAAYAAAGPDIGSPVIQLPEFERGVHGPIIGEGMDADSLALWDAVARLIAMPAFVEIKRGRR